LTSPDYRGMRIIVRADVPPNTIRVARIEPDLTDLIGLPRPSRVCTDPTHRCKHCLPELEPSCPRKGEHHFAVRFGQRDFKLKVRIDGVESKRTYEVLAGENGTAWRYVEHPDGGLHVHCRAADDDPLGACAEIVHGHVQVYS
jgi:hypothetical protein